MKREQYLSEAKLYREDPVYNYRELLEKCAEKYGEEIAFAYKDRAKNYVEVSYLQYKEDVEDFATALLHMGLQDKKIGIFSPNRYEWCVGYLAIANAGSVVVPLDYALPENEVRTLINRSEMECIIFDKKSLGIVEQVMREGTTALKYAVCLDYDEKQGDIFAYRELLAKGGELREKGNAAYEKLHIDKDKMSILLFTSGTTSKSKAVMLSQYNVCSNITAMSTLIKSKENDNVLVFLPLHHTLACTASFLFCFYTKFRIYFAEGIKHVAKNMKEFEIRGLVCVPAVLDLMYKKTIKEIKKQKKYAAFKIMSAVSNLLCKFNIDIRRTLFKNILEGFGGKLRVIIYGSASTKKKVMKFFTTIGIDMIQGYGLTESSPVIACESDGFHNKAKSTGYPLYNLEVKIDEKDENGVGEIAVKGPSVMLGYYEDEAATKEAIRDGWLYTGDLGYLDKKGQLYVTGRKKDLIVLSSGKKVNPEEVEELLNSSDYIAESLVYADGDSKILAKIVYSKDNELLQGKSEKQIHKLISAEIRKVNSLLPKYKYISKFTITTESLSKTTTNKIKRFEELKKLLKIG
ncbi:MAG: AMP-binding protein [Oscillospiraceae bacterium]|jgi:long-chain acyl-CoA synthetase|nr:AMP-binding protein [Oscillospiraceae bacterium]